MKNIALLLFAIILSTTAINLIAWTKDNAREKLYTEKEYVMSSKVPAAQPDKQYFYKYTIIETAVPGKFPGTFDAKLDTIKKELWHKPR